MELPEKASRVLEDLLADHERLGGRLDTVRAERLFQKRELSLGERLAVEDALEDHGIILADHDEIAAQAHESVAEPHDAGVEPGLEETIGDNDSESIGPWDSLLKEPLLDDTQVAELARRFALGEQARKAVEKGEESDTKKTREIVARGLEARNKLVQHNLRLVVSIAKKYPLPLGFELFDLVQEGVFGLLRAAERYDYQRGFRFSTYATWWIRQSISRSLQNQVRLVRYPVHVEESIGKLKKAERRLTRIYAGREPTIEQLADELGWPPDMVAFIQDLDGMRVISADADISGTEGMSLLDTLPSPELQPMEVVALQDLGGAVRAALSELPTRERKILTMRFGLDDHQPKTLEQVGQVYGLTRERIRQVQNKALLRLGRVFRDRGIMWTE